MVFYASEKLLDILQKITKKANIEAEFIIMNAWKDGEQTASQLKEDEALILFMAKRGMASYIPRMRMIPDLLNRSLADKNYLLIFPYSEAEDHPEKRSVGNHDDFMEIGNVIKKIFK